MSAEKIGMVDFFQSVMDATNARSNAALEAVATFQAGRAPREDREFDSTTRDAIAKRYMALRLPSWGQVASSLEFERDVFVRIVEGYGNGLAAICATMPPGQEDRREKVRQLAGALQRLQEVLLTIDSGALAQTLNEMDKALHDGTARHATDPVESFIVAGDVRQIAGDPLSALIVGAATAAKVLDEPNYDPILETIWQLERLFDEHGLPFEVKDSGFAAECFRAMYELANPGKSKDRPKYLLNKAVMDSRSWANFKAGLRKKLP